MHPITDSLDRNQKGTNIVRTPSGVARGSQNATPASLEGSNLSHVQEVAFSTYARFPVLKDVSHLPEHRLIFLQ